MQRTIFDSEHDQFRETARAYYEKECAPHALQWERDGQVSREAWLRAGEQGLLGWEFPEEYGGLGIKDFRYNVILTEEQYLTGTVGMGLNMLNDILMGYLNDLTTEEQKARWIPGFITGENIPALALSEPGAGSDLRNISTTASREGDHYVVSGSKTFISNGILADRILTAVKTDPNAGHKGISLVMVEADMPGFVRGRKLDKIGTHAADTAELFFDQVRVPVANLVGEEGRGFYHLMRNLPAERLGIANHAVAQSRRALDLTISYARDRSAFGQSIGSFQVNRHALAEMSTKLQILQIYLDRCIEAVNVGELSAEEAAGAKYWATETQWEILDRCLQLHGGYGYINEYEIARLWRDARVQRLYGGTSEIMLDIIGRSLGF